MEIEARDSQGEIVPLGTLQNQAVRLAREAWKHSEDAVRAAWFAGQMFNEIKARMPFGNFQAWLATEDIGERTARTWMRIARDLSLDDAIAAGSIRSAEKLLMPAPEPKLTPAEPMEPPSPFDETDTLRARAEQAERERDELVVKLDEVQERAAVVLADEADDSRAADIWRETEAATQATQAAREEVGRIEQQLHQAQGEIRRLQSRLDAVKAALLTDESASEILAVHFGVQAKGKAERDAAIIEAIREGQSLRSISREFNLALSTVQNIRDRDMAA